MPSLVGFDVGVDGTEPDDQDHASQHAHQRDGEERRMPVEVGAHLETNVCDDHLDWPARGHAEQVADVKPVYASAHDCRRTG